MGAEQQAALPGHGSGLAGDTSPHLLHVRCLSRLPKPVLPGTRESRGVSATEQSFLCWF
jgi:hypothetical protein